jgi:hypothetical protein
VGESGELVLPRIVDDSIGMYVLRRMTGRSGGGRSPAGPRGATPPADPRPFDSAMARRLGIRRASDVVVVPRVAAGTWLRPAAVADGSGRTGPRRTVIGLLAVAAIVVGVALGTGLAMLGPHGAPIGFAGQPASGSEPHGSVSPPLRTVVGRAGECLRYTPRA